jgi:23S rRNA pseudouridine1911/1915/1917 synthase
MSARPPDRAGAVGEGADERVILNDEVFLPSGRVDPEAVRRLAEAASEARDDSELPRVTFELKSDLKKRLDKYLTDRIGFMSRNQLQKLIDEGGVVVNGRQPKASTVLRKGDVVEVLIPPPPSKEIQAEDIPLDVLYEDAHLIVINKSPDIIVHPARSHLKGTMINALAWHLRRVTQKRSDALTQEEEKRDERRENVPPGLSSVGAEFARPGVVHRLDRHTSGCIVFAKDDEAHWKLGHQFEHRRVDKRYLAVVHGRIEPAADVIEAPIGPHPSREKGYREKYVVRHDEQGKHAVTIYRVREWYNPHAADPMERYTLVELELKTGRTHQIRVHLSHLGWPIVGDDMYGGRPYSDGAGRTLIARQALHAAVLGFRHPISGEPMAFTAPLRGDMAALVTDLRAKPGHTVADISGATVELGDIAK